MTVFSFVIHSWGGCQGLCFLRYSTADFKVCLGSLSCCRSHPLSYYSIYTDGLMFACRICWYFIESILFSTTEMFPVPLAETQAKSMIDLSPCLAVATVVHFFMKSCTKQLCLLQPQNDFFFFFCFSSPQNSSLKCLFSCLFADFQS